MPGSKTYTSNKVNELFEIEMQESAYNSEAKKTKSIACMFFVEILKISLSLLGTIYFNYKLNFSNLNISEKLSYSDQILFLIKIICGFIVLYLSLAAFIIILKIIIEWLFGKRVFRGFRRKAYALFHKRILNYIYLGASFENKYNKYLNNYLNDNNSPDYSKFLDLTMDYFSQSLYYFNKAYIEIDEFYPKKVKQNGRKEKLNAIFLNRIGFSHLIISFVSAYNSLKRLDDSIDLLETRIVHCPNIISESYKLAIDDLKQSYIMSLISNYDMLIIRTKALSQCFNNQKTDNNLLIALYMLFQR